MKKLYLALFLGILFSLCFVSALGETIREAPSLKDELIITPEANIYPAIQLKDNWDIPLLSKDLADLVLTKHTSSCSNCDSIFNINTYQDSVLIDNIKFLKQEGNKWLDSSFNNYKIYIQTGETINEVNDYDWSCKGNGIITKGGAEEQSCERIITGTHEETIPTWEEYTIGDKKTSGEYTIKIEGNKAYNEAYDWQITTQGKLISEWATWGISNNNITGGWDFDNNLVGINVTLVNITGTNVYDTGTINQGINFTGTRYIQDTSASGGILKVATDKMTYAFWF
jgi:hypothetical protein